MTSQRGKTRCVYCEKEKVTYECNGCKQYFCLEHLNEHNREHTKQLDAVVNQRNLVQETLLEQQTNIEKHNLFEQVNEWEKKSINIIIQTANKIRQTLTDRLKESLSSTEIKLAQLTDELNQIRIQNEFNEIHINKFNEILNQLSKQIEQPQDIAIKQNSSYSFINKISVINPNSWLNIRSIPLNGKWSPNGITVAGGNGKGDQLNQLNDALGFCIDENQTIYIADSYNHRIIAWKKDATAGIIVAGGNGSGAEINQLNVPMNVIVDENTNTIIITDRGNQRIVRWPRENGTSGEIIIENINCWDLALDSSGCSLYVSDCEKNEIRRWKIGEKEGILVAGGNGKGDNLHQLNEPRSIFIDQNESVYVADWKNHRIMKWIKDVKQGVIIAGGGGFGNSLKETGAPNGIVVDELGTLYVIEGNNDRVMRWVKTAIQGELVVGSNGNGVEANQFNVPTNLAFDRENNLYALDGKNQRVQKFQFGLLE